MMSGAAEAPNVQEARDCGANEFIAKPFSAESVSLRVLQIINSPREIILGQTGTSVRGMISIQNAEP
jgi:DNA-binding NtrC family response regulator